MSLFLPYDLRPHEGNPVKHHLIAKSPFRDCSVQSRMLIVETLTKCASRKTSTSLSKWQRRVSMFIPQCQDAFDHDKGEICNFGVPSPLDFLEFPPVFSFLCPCAPGLLFKFVRKSPQNMEKIA